MKSYLIMNLKLNLYYKSLLENASKRQELKWLKNGNFPSLMIIEEDSYKLKRLNSWKPKDLKLLETEEDVKLREEHYNTEQQKNKDTEVLWNWPPERWQKTSSRTLEETHFKN